MPTDSFVLVPKRGGSIAPGGQLLWVQSFMGSLGGFLVSIGGILILAGAGVLFCYFIICKILFFSCVGTMTPKSNVVWQLVRQPVDTMFISNNLTSFHLWWKENLVKYQKVSKCYENDCVQNFLLLFLSLLTAPVAKNSQILAGIYFIFPKNVLKQIWESFNNKFGPQPNYGKSSYEVRQIWTTFCNLIALIFS